MGTAVGAVIGEYLYALGASARFQTTREFFAYGLVPGGTQSDPGRRRGSHARLAA
jgi:hypothetical protein